MRRVSSVVVMVHLFWQGVSLGQQDTIENASIRAFLSSGFGAVHEDAPKEVEQFGRLVGLWRVEVEIARRSGGWQKSEPGIWAWKYTLDGFAVSDLWLQASDALPIYMKDLGRDYLLSSNRVFDISSKKWRVAWMANGAGAGQGADFGTFTAALEDEAIVMRSPKEPGGYGSQRVVFDAFTDTSFEWRSEYSTDDGTTWQTVMRMSATRIED